MYLSVVSYLLLFAGGASSNGGIEWEFEEIEIEDILEG